MIGFNSCPITASKTIGMAKSIYNAIYYRYLTM
jgi:hypothetical protein